MCSNKSVIQPTGPGHFGYEVWDQGKLLLSRATPEQVQQFLADLGPLSDLDPRQYHDLYEGRTNACWCGEPAVMAWVAVDPRDWHYFMLPRCGWCA